MKLLIFPQDTNPYQTLLYSSMVVGNQLEYLNPRVSNKLEAVFYAPRLSYRLAVSRIKGFRMLHIHWLYTFSLPAKIPFSKQIAYVNTITFLYFARLMGYRIVWTVHNVLPNEEVTSDDLKVRKKLSKMSSAKIVHSVGTIDRMSTLGIDTSNYTVIPHGNYTKSYENVTKKPEARKELNIPQGAKVILFFGLIKSYKNIPALLKAFDNITKKNSGLKLIIAGKSSDTNLNNLLDEARTKYGNSIHIYNQYIESNQVQRFFNAADAVVFPFRDITTSGSVLLALTFGKPIIAPRVGALNDLPKNVGYFYEPTETGDLEKKMQLAIDDNVQLEEKAESAKAYATSLAWDLIAEKTQLVYEKIERNYNEDGNSRDDGAQK